jgi:acyl-coenzyme A synthetase/AMP-(fatty) acid ligase
VKKEIMETVGSDFTATGRPREVLFVPELPKNASAMTLRDLLPSLVLNPRATHPTIINCDCISPINDAIAASALANE